MCTDYFCCVPQCCLFVSATSTDVPLCLSSKSLFELDPVFDIDRAFVCNRLRRSLPQFQVICRGYTGRCWRSVLHVSVEVLEETARTASGEAKKKASGCRRVMAAVSSPPCRSAGRGSSLSLGVFLWWLMVIAFNLSRLLASCRDADQVGKHGPYPDDNSCTMAAHSFDVAMWLGTDKMLMRRCELHEELDLCCENEVAYDMMSCSLGESVYITRLREQEEAVGKRGAQEIRRSIGTNKCGCALKRSCGV